MKYISTRGAAPALSFEEAMLTGLALDGGLYVPAHIPKLSKEEIIKFLTNSFMPVKTLTFTPTMES